MLIRRYKNNVSLYLCNNYRTEIGITKFYLFPTVEFYIDKTLDDDQGIDVKFEWLFWSFEISKCWGSVYENFPFSEERGE